MMRSNRPNSIDDVAFTIALTIASRVLGLRDKLFRRVSGASSQHPSLRISRTRIASSSEALDAVFVAPADTPTRASVLICHGIGETVDYWFDVQRLLATDGVASLVFDYAGYGRSTGRIRWRQCEQDAIEAFCALKALLPDTPASVLGFSLGSGVAAAILDRVSPRNLILCSSFSSFQAAACCTGLPHRISGLAPPIWDTKKSLRACSVPVLVLHCEDDGLFPAQMAQDLVSDCTERARLIIVPNHRHNFPYRRPQRQFWGHVVAMLVPDYPRMTSAQSVSKETE